MIRIFTESAAACEKAGMSAELMEITMKGIEDTIRRITNNDFASRLKYFTAPASGGILMGASPYINETDNVMISGSGLNDGVYQVWKKTDASTTLDRPLYDADSERAALVTYPPAVIAGANAMLLWEASYRGKAGIKSESLSRYSVAYADPDAEASNEGYPSMLIGFLTPFYKGRF